MALMRYVAEKQRAAAAPRTIHGDQATELRITTQLAGSR
jgi:hypothetical protein